ncbi:MAG: hypothetical protein DRH50_05175 [Deltaproteobacteria bacterium]|nr:MAG: hypothetical protein DRH50_05175 [Deltaproteobacteria bacterium]
MNYRRAFLFMLIVQFFYFTPVFLKGEVIFAHNNAHELGVQVGDDAYISNRKFSDQSNTFIPEINHHLNGNHQSWLSTWNPYVQMGRPTWQFCAFGKAWLLTNLLSFFTNNPFVFYTSLTVLTVVLTGVFFFLFLKTIGLHPLACSSAAIGLSLGTLISYWLTFVMFPALFCWTSCLLWLIASFLKKRSYGAVVGISFATYSLLLTGYPQDVILHLYLVGGYTLFRLLGSGGSIKRRIRDGLALGISFLIGAITAFPVLADMVVLALRSARLDAGDGFFLSILPRIEGVKDLWFYGSLIFDAFWAGNPIRPEYPFPFEGFSLNPLYFGLFVLSFAGGRWRRVWAWQLFFALCVMTTLWLPAYLFAVRYLGFHFSSSQLIGGGLIPAFVLGAYSVDTLLRTGMNRKFAAFLLMASFIMAVLPWFHYHELWHTEFVAASFLLMIGSVLFCLVPRPILLQCLIVVTVFVYGHKMVLARPLYSIEVSSRIVKEIKAVLGDRGARFAKVGNISGILPPNQEALLKIRSIHSYDGLSPVNYQRSVLAFSDVGSVGLGKYFCSIDTDSKLGQEAFSYAGVGALLSPRKLDARLFKKTGETNGIGLYEPLHPVILRAQITGFERPQAGKDVVVRGFLHENRGPGRIETTVLYDDYQEIKVASCSQETLLFLSRQYHPKWRAFSRGAPLETVIINDFYQGVIIPPDTNEVSLEFRPFVLWSWIPQVMYLGIGLLLLLGRWMRAKPWKTVRVQ